MPKTNWEHVNKMLSKKSRLLHELSDMSGRIEFGPHGIIHGEAQAYNIFIEFVETSAQVNEERRRG